MGTKSSKSQKSKRVSLSDTNGDMMTPEKEKKKEKKEKKKEKKEQKKEKKEKKEKEKEKRHPSSKKKKVMYKKVVCGQTFGAHDQILEQIETSGLNLEEINDEESCVTILFCPVTSRIGTDAEAAVRMVPGDDRVILVLMHYSQEPKHVSSSEVLSSYPKVVSEVHVFYHDRQDGLLRCEQNEKAVIKLKTELKKYRKSQRSGSKSRKSSSSPSS